MRPSSLDYEQTTAPSNVEVSPLALTPLLALGGVGWRLSRHADSPWAPMVAVTLPLLMVATAAAIRVVTRGR